MVPVAAGAPVHAAHQRPVAAEQQLDVVDLLPAVVDRVEADRHPQRGQTAPGLDRHGDRGIEDDPHIGSTRPGRDKQCGKVGTAELVHLDQHPAARGGQHLRDRLEDARVLPEPARGRRHRRRRRAPTAGTQPEDGKGGGQRAHGPASLP